MVKKLNLVIGVSCAGKTSYCQQKAKMVSFDKLFSYGEARFNYAAFSKAVANLEEVYMDGYVLRIDEDLKKLKAACDPDVEIEIHFIYMDQLKLYEQQIEKNKRQDYHLGETDKKKNIGINIDVQANINKKLRSLLKRNIISRIVYIKRNGNTYTFPEDDRDLYATLNLIPPRMSFYWGRNPMSWMRFMTLKSFRDVNPNWEVTLYCSENTIAEKTWSGPEMQDYFIYSGPDYMERVEKIGVNIQPWHPPDELPGMISIHESDLFSWSLHKNGGLYADMDILWIRPVDELYDQIKFYHGMICCQEYLSIGFLASSINSPFFKDAYRSAIKDYDPKRYQWTGNEAVYRLLKKKIKHDPNLFQDILKKYPHLNLFNLPMPVVYPVPWKLASLIYAPEGFPISHFNNSIGLHWFGGSGASQGFNKTVTEKNYRSFNNTFTNLVTEFVPQ